MDDALNNSYRFEDFDKKYNLTFGLNGTYATLWFPGSFGVVRAICLVVVSVLGAGFNTFMIVAIIPNRKLRTVRNMLLVHLGGVGLLSSVSVTIYPVLITFHGSWLGGTRMCQAYANLSCLLTSVSVWTIAALSWDKYQTIASPLHHSLGATLKTMLPYFSTLWLCGVVLLLPPLFGANEFFLFSPLGICGLNISSTAGRWYISVIVCLSFIIPSCIVIYCYTHIFRIARTQSSRIAATMLRMVKVIQVPAAPTSHGSSSLRGVKAMGTILQLIGSFLLTYLPYTCVVLYEVIFAAKANAILASIATTLFLAAPLTHAAIYGVKNPILRSSFRRYARRKVQHWCIKDNRRSNSIRSMNRKHSASIKMSIKYTVKCDEKQCILQRTVICQSRPLDDQTAAYENKASSLPRPFPFDMHGDTNNWASPFTADLNIDNCCSQFKDTDSVKQASFCEAQNTLFKYSNKTCENSPFGEIMSAESDCDTIPDELVRLYPLTDISDTLDYRHVNKKKIYSRDKLKYTRRKKKSKRQWRITDHEDMSIYSVENIDSRFEQTV
ncbi:unnamed protein product [Candidula unifasciata]|uniref:G-protein coupled receptors family 1 profile domain-containing protein n=1 Tax=Candidula unifasciata TaxID=100452 RepID=A0A8S3YIX6_9EUPU|nr:unnamed protein product [Candidula unifasciata]